MRNVMCLALLAFSTVAAQQQSRGGINFYSRNKEISVGKELAGEFRNQTTPLANDTVRDYVSAVGAKLAAQFSGGWNYQFEIVQQNTDGATCEPAAFPSGFIFVSRDLIAAAHSEAEFAGMLAHAMAHVDARHWTRNATRQDLMQVETLSGPNAQNVPAAIPLGLIEFQRALERQADYFAAKAMAGAGFDPQGLASYVERVQPLLSGLRKTFDPLPDRVARVKAIRGVITKLPARTYEAGGQFAEVQAQVVAH